MKRLSSAEEELGRDRMVPDLVQRGLRLLLVGINPSLSSGATGYHFATPGNRLWAALFGAGLTTRLLEPDETEELLRSGLGITNIVNRATRTADEVEMRELIEGARILRTTVAEYEPQLVAILGIGAYRLAFENPTAKIGRQPSGLGPSQLWVLPNPSRRNGHYQIPRLVELFRAVREAIEEAERDG